ncbi:DUF533 domain-containing protein, partial [Neisseria gonorrhoeae]|uniref:DUF533 domain-containing protein n=1 Tax=Neisseria gonorrhoeae TaxID=485 RepID=UPI0035A37CDF
GGNFESKPQLPFQVFHQIVIQFQSLRQAGEEDGFFPRQIGTDPETAAWLTAEYRLPASIEDIAASVGNDEALAAEVYLAAR